MTRTEAQKRARARYTSEKVKRVSVCFYPAETDLWAHLESVGNMSGYVKSLIRADMERGDKEAEK